MLPPSTGAKPEEPLVASFNDIGLESETSSKNYIKMTQLEAK